MALIGSNGAGKSTVARTVSGLVSATSGTVYFAGRDVTTSPAWRIARMGIAHVVEGRGVFASLTVEENLVLAFHQRAGRRAVLANLQRAFEAFPVLGERRRQKAGTLSGGQQRLLSLAKVLVVPPKLLVADELCLGLAPIVIDAVYNGLREINKSGTALLLVEQQVDRALELADKALVLDRGAVAYEGAASGALAAVEHTLTGAQAAAEGVGEIETGGLGHAYWPRERTRRATAPKGSMGIASALDERRNDMGAGRPRTRRGSLAP